MIGLEGETLTVAEVERSLWRECAGEGVASMMIYLLCGPGEGWTGAGAVKRCTRRWQH